MEEQNAGRPSPSEVANPQQRSSTIQSTEDQHCFVHHTGVFFVGNQFRRRPPTPTDSCRESILGRFSEFRTTILVPTSSSEQFGATRWWCEAMQEPEQVGRSSGGLPEREAGTRSGGPGTKWCCLVQSERGKHS